MNDLLSYTIDELSELLSLRQLSSRELTQLCLDRIALRDGELGAFLTVCAEDALSAADEIDRRRVSGESLPKPAGIPFALKDNICTEGIRTTCASKMLEGFVPPYSATAAKRLTDSGAILLGKLNMDEFAMGSTTESSAFKPTRNPIDCRRTPGGSSGGSAAATASGEAIFTLGSDTGGSVRQPAAFCGVVGLCPTYGRVSRYGLVAFASSLDRIGPITRTIRDSALILNIIAGHDRLDATSSRRSEDFTSELDGGVRGMRIGIPKNDSYQNSEVKAAMQSAAESFEKLGAELVPIDTDFCRSALSAYYVISSAEASSNLARYDGVRYGRRSETEELEALYKRSRSEGFGAEVKRRIMLGTFVLSAGYYDEYYRSACLVRRSIKRGFARVFGECDLIMTPTAPTPAFFLGEERSPTELYAGDLYTVPSSLAGLPALSLPCRAASSEAQLPVGIQLIGSEFAESRLLRAGQALERERSAR